VETLAHRPRQSLTRVKSFDQVGPVSRSERTTPDALAEALTILTGRCLALEARNRELKGGVTQLRAQRRQLRSRAAAVSSLQPVQASRRVRTALASDEERRRLERDLHDGVQNELVALIVKLSLAQQDPDTPHALAGTLSAAWRRSRTSQNTPGAAHR
jgi:signal transduction histidine kinase